MTREERAILNLEQKVNNMGKDIEKLKELVIKLNDNGNTRSRKSGRPAGESVGAEKQDN